MNDLEHLLDDEIKHIIENFKKKLLENMENTPPEYNDIVDKNFWTLS